MKHSRFFLGFSLAVGAVVLSQNAAAFSLGRLRGATVLGQPLELSVPVLASADEDISSLCVAADTYFGESPVESSLVRTRIESSSAGGATIRLSVSKPVDEPVVTVYLRTGCQTQSTRKYVLLAEFSSDTAQLPVMGETVAKPPLSVSLNSSSPSFATVTGSIASSFAKPQKRKVSRNEGVVPLAQRGEVSAAPLAASEVESRKKSGRNELVRGGARLKLQPLEISASWEPSLRMTNDLQSPSAEFDANRRAEAAALWRVLNATPQEILQEAAKRAALEAELQNLQTMSSANQLALADLSQKLKTAQESRFTNPLVYVLLALLLACGAFLGYVLRQKRSDDGAAAPWWSGNPGGAPIVDGAIADPHQSVWPASTSQADSPEQSARVGLSANGKGRSEADIPVVDSSVSSGLSGLATTPRVVGPKTKNSDFGHSVIGALRAINTQEMVDVRQQADFFQALGQYDEAISLLYGALSNGSEANPHIYLDLIALLHKLSRKDEFEKVRQAFNAVYTCHLPEFGAYADEGLNLMDYAELCQPLVVMWPSRSALDYIETCLVRTAEDAVHSGISLAAFKDLLMLHGILGVVADSATDSRVHKAVERVLPLIQQITAGGGQSSPYLMPSRSAMHIDLDLS